MKNKNKKKKYDLIFRVTEGVFQPFYIELFVIKSGYGRLNFIVLNENMVKEMYLAEKDRLKPAKIGLNLYANRTRVKRLIADGYKYVKKEKALLKLASNLNKKSNKELKRILDKIYVDFTKFLDIYSYTEVMYSPLIEKTIREHVSSNIKDSHRANHIFAILVNPSKKKKVSREREQFFGKNNTPTKIINLCESVREVGVEKLVLRLSLMNYWAATDMVLEEIAKRVYMSPKQIKGCYYKEVVALLFNKKINLAKLAGVVNERSRRLAGVKVKNKWAFYTGKKAESIIKRIKPKINKNIKEFRGDIASLGVKRGRVVVLPSGIGEENIKELKIKMQKMKKGDILVAATTGPEMIVACRKAGAIVAEEGGINSHAAIISRELDIPGIVNTDIATMVLKDGDLIEVDANKGIVKILKKKK